MKYKETFSSRSKEIAQKERGITMQKEKLFTKPICIGGMQAEINKEVHRFYEQKGYFGAETTV